MRAHKLVLTITISLLALSQIGCGSKKFSSSGSTDQASREVVDSNTNTASKNLALCNRGSTSQATADLMVYKDANGSRMDYLRVKLSNVTSDFSASGKDVAVRFYKWKMNANGSRFADNDPLKMRLESRNGFQAVGNYNEELSWGFATAAAKSAGVTLSSQAHLFDNYSLLVDLRDYSGEYDVIRMIVYNGETITSQKDILIPAFFANPSAYQFENDGVTARPTELVNLHPFIAQANQGWTDTHFVSESQRYCF